MRAARYLDLSTVSASKRETRVRVSRLLAAHDVQQRIADDQRE